MTSDEGAEWRNEIGIPVVGFEIGSGKLVGVSEEGGTSAPVVALVIVDVMENKHSFTLDPRHALELSKLLSGASHHSVDAFIAHNPEVAKAERRERRHKIAALCVATFLIVGFSALVGQAETGRYVHHGGTMAGVIAGWNEFLQMIGMIFLFISAMMGARRLGARRAAKKAAKPAPLGPDAPPEESIP